MDGKGWYLLVDENGKVSVEKVFYSDELRFYFIVKMLKDYEVDDGERSEIIFNILNENNKRCDKKIKKDFGFFLFEVVWILQDFFNCDGCMFDIMLSIFSFFSFFCIFGSLVFIGEWIGFGDNLILVQ